MHGLARKGSRMNRRSILLGAAAGSVAVMLGTTRPASATPDEVAKFLTTTLGPGTPTPGKITIGAPEIAENGNTVPITITVDSPMTAQNYVKQIVVAADGNPTPAVAQIDLGPANGTANVSFRIRLAKTQTITAVAQMSDGTMYSATRLIKVTIGGCGG